MRDWDDGTSPSSVNTNGKNERNVIRENAGTKRNPNELVCNVHFKVLSTARGYLTTKNTQTNEGINK